MTQFQTSHWLQGALASVLTLATLLSAFGVEARGRKRILVLRTEGESVSAADRAKLTTQLLRAARRYKQFGSIASKQDLVEEMFAFECTDPDVDCLAKIGKKYRATHVVYNEVVRNREGKQVWSMRVVVVNSRRLSASRVAQSTQQPLAALTAAPESARKGLVVMIGPTDLPDDTAQQLGTLIVRMVGGGVALVYGNDKLLGRTSVTGLRKQLLPGKYKLKVVRAGYEDWSLAVTVSAGKVTSEMVELVRAAPVPMKSPAQAVDKPVTRRWWFWPAVVGGVAAIGATVWALTREGDSPTNGVVGFSIDSADAHRDPVFVSP